MKMEKGSKNMDLLDEQKAMKSAMSLDLSAVHRMNGSSCNWEQRDKITGYFHNPGGK